MLPASGLPETSTEASMMFPEVVSPDVLSIWAMPTPTKATTAAFKGVVSDTA